MNSSALTEQFSVLQRGYTADRVPLLAVRSDWLRRLKRLLLENEEALCEALSRDFGYRSSDQSAFADITTTVKSVNHALRHLRVWMRGERRSPDLSLRLSGARCRTRPSPKGVVGIISPWNFPVNLALSPLVSVLAAGNRAFIKPSEATPETAALLSRLIAHYYQPDEVAVACGGVDVARDFVQLEFDHLIYTGGGRVARSIARATADNLVPLTLELGGKSPVLVAPSADLKRVAHRVVFGKYFNAGQICIAPDTLLVGHQHTGKLVEYMRLAVQRADSSARANDSVCIINEQHRARLKTLIEDAAAHGAEIHRLPGSANNGYELTLVINPGAQAAINREEIFGPVLLIKSLRDFDAQLRYINDQPPPLVLYYFGKRRDEFQRLADTTRSGALVKNDVIFQYANDDLPFGGIGASGIGKYRGADGFREFSYQRAVYEAGGLDIALLVTPPYSRFFGAINRLMRKL